MIIYISGSCEVSIPKGVGVGSVSAWKLLYDQCLPSIQATCWVIWVFDMSMLARKPNNMPVSFSLKNAFLKGAQAGSPLSVSA